MHFCGSVITHYNTFIHSGCKVPWAIPRGCAFTAATSADQRENVCNFSHGQPVCMKLFCETSSCSRCPQELFSKVRGHRNSPNEGGMCCFYNESFTLVCCVHMYKQSVLCSVSPFLRNVLRYVRTRQISVKPIYIRSCHSLHAHESPHPPSGRVCDIIAMLQIVLPSIGNHGVAEAAGFQRCKRVFLAPPPLDRIEVFGADRRMRFASDISLRFHKIKDIVVVTLDRFPVLPAAVTLFKFKVVGNKPLQPLECPQEDSLYFGFHFLCKVRIIGSVRRLFLGG